MPLSEDYKTVLVVTYGTGDDYRNWDVTKVNNFKNLLCWLKEKQVKH